RPPCPPKAKPSRKAKSPRALHRPLVPKVPSPLSLALSRPPPERSLRHLQKAASRERHRRRKLERPRRASEDRRRRVTGGAVGPETLRGRGRDPRARRAPGGAATTWSLQGTHLGTDCPRAPGFAARLRLPLDRPLAPARGL